MKYPDMDDRILLRLSDGRARTRMELYKEIYGRIDHCASTAFQAHLQSLTRHGYLKRTRIGRFNYYTISGAEASLVEIDPDALVGKDFDPTKVMREAVMELLGDGKPYTADQLVRAYYPRTVNPGRFSETYKKTQMSNTCNKLVRDERLEKVEIRGMAAWRIPA